jgi:adenylate cyclase
VTSDPSEPAHPKLSQFWFEVLSGDYPGLQKGVRRFRRMPSPPRCKLCNVPFKGPFRPVLRLLGFNRWPLNEQMCSACMKSMERHSGGAEIEVSVLYADIRGSTTMAETVTPSEFSKTLDRFYALVTMAVDHEDGIIDHMAGDGVMAFWIPGFVGPGHPMRAMAAGRRLIADLASEPGLTIPVGVAVHTGKAYVGVVGSEGSKDFTVLGDVPNTVARLASSAGPGELVISEAIATVAGSDTSGLERRMLTLKGKTEPFPAWIAPAQTRRPVA